ncbi:uroporphyrinogen decarboxylase [Helicobacter bizzozeronii]|uniref:uroporphyrinogen decarboxylase n=1 Tax=Helicobacter bizzozeronii TaxID=56877 RepID=UPI000CF0709D|nr:uroporphyrinogen decarboxylase [Helicobacter bizzozeronii]
MIFIDACHKKQTPYTPIWMMRQAGRYLSEYRALRQQAKNFLDLCSNVDLATQITLQPVEILGVDAAILFSDILVIPHAMGLDLEFIPQVGPKFLHTISTLDQVQALQSQAYQKLDFVYETLLGVRAKLDPSKALIGFSGAPWTLATYMIEGEGSKTYHKSKKLLYTQPHILHALLEKLSVELIAYLSRQIQAGADAVMIFDSWAGALELEAYLEFSWKYIQHISQTLKSKHPNTPIIVFPKGVAGFLGHLGGEFDVFGCDWSTPLDLAKRMLGDRYVLQGNLEPARLYDRGAMLDGVERILKVVGKQAGFIFNLGHGMIKDLPRENALELVKFVQTQTAR